MMKGQLSAEMLILIAVVLAVVAIAATRLISTAKSSSESVGNQSADLLDKSSAAVKGRPGDFCTRDEDCLPGSGCDAASYVCR